MNKSFYDIILELTPYKQMDKACQSINKQKEFSGFRKGRAPVPLILNLSKIKPRLQKQICTEIALAVFPDPIPDDVLTSKFDITDENLVYYLAAYIAKGKEENFPYGIDAILAAHAPVPPVKKVAVGVPDSPEMDGLVLKAERNMVTDAQEIASTSIVANKKEQPKDQSKSIEKSSSTVYYKPLSSEKTESIGGTKMQYLGNIQVVPSDYGIFSFYNFYPVAIIESDGKIRMLDYYERKELFPDVGNINIFSATKDDDHLAELFRQGEFFVLDITDDIVLENRKPNSDRRYSKIEIATLEARHALHTPKDFNLYPIIEFTDAASAFSENRLIRLTQQQSEGRYDEDVMLHMGNNEYVGPFTLVPDQNTNTCYINPQSKKKNYLFSVYHGQTTDDFLFSVPDYSSSSNPQEIQYINLNEMQCELRDYIPEDALVQELSTILASQDDETLSTPIESAFAGLELPHEIASVRRERLVNCFSQITSLNHTVDSISQILGKLLVRAVNEEKEHFDSVFSVLAKDTQFMLHIQRNRRIAEEIKRNEDRLEQLTAEYAEIQRQREETEQQLETKQAAILTESIQKKQAELAGVEAKLAERLKAHNLADNIHDLEVRLDAQKLMLRDAKKEEEEIRGQTQKILDTFRNDVKEPMAQIAHVILNAEIESIISDAADKAMHRKAQADDRLASRFIQKLSSQCDTSISVSNILDTLYGRISLHRSYTRNEVVNLLICLTQGFLTVFSGAPGTGKTSVCSIIAHALGLDKQVSINVPSDDEQENVIHNFERYVVVPVERGWSSKRDFVGYYNPLTKAFDKANSAIFQALEVSDEETRMTDTACIPPSVIMLDEANLSPMEYYWADFMSVCDDVNGSSVINLSENDRFKVSKSLRFMATINNDHTTENLSPRLIDRAWVISLPQPNSPRITRFEEYYEPVPMEMLQKAFDFDGKLVSLDTVTESILKEVFELCRDKLNTNVSPRTEIAIRKYCKVGSSLFESSKSGVDGPIVAIDYAVAQKILPKVQGSGAVYKKKLEEFNEALVRNNLLKSSEMLNRIIQRGDRNMQYYQFFA